MLRTSIGGGEDEDLGSALSRVQAKAAVRAGASDKAKSALQTSGMEGPGSSGSAGHEGCLPRSFPGVRLPTIAPSSPPDGAEIGRFDWQLDRRLDGRLDHEDGYPMTLSAAAFSFRGGVAELSRDSAVADHRSGAGGASEEPSNSQPAGSETTVTQVNASETQTATRKSPQTASESPSADRRQPGKVSPADPFLQATSTATETPFASTTSALSRELQLEISNDPSQDLPTIPLPPPEASPQPISSHTRSSSSRWKATAAKGRSVAKGPAAQSSGGMDAETRAAIAIQK